MLPEYDFDYRKARPNRFVERIDNRLTEAAKLGFKQAVIPKLAAKGLAPIAGMEVVAVEKADEALDKLI